MSGPEESSALIIEGLKKSFRSPDGELTAIVDVPQFRLGKGEQIALRGMSGSGKTTLLNLIAGILTPDAGRVVVAGCEVTALSESQRDRARATTIGYVFQTFNLLQGFSSLENVMLGMMFGVAVARALANRPQLVLADEPTGNLDPRHAREALALIRDVCQEHQAALLLVSHDQEVLSQFARVDELAHINRAAA